VRSNRIAICLALTISLCTAQANKPKQASSQKTNAEAKKSQPASSSLIVVRDEDGALRAPTAAESLALTGAVQASGPSAGQTIDQGPGKGLMLVLDPATANVYSVVTKGPDGKLKMECVSGEKAANKAALTGTVQTHPLKEEISDK